jgi:hypothetical protein
MYEIGRGMYGRRTHTGFWQENLKGRDQLEDLGIHERLILK